MAEARRREAWDRTSHVMWIIATGLLRKRGGGEFRPRDFDFFRGTTIEGEIDAKGLGDVLEPSQ